MKPCGKIVKTIERPMPCVCEVGHEGGCNPFSPNPNITKKENPEDYLWREGQYKCPWVGEHGCCIYRLGHFPNIPHKESQEKY